VTYRRVLPRWGCLRTWVFGSASSSTDGRPGRVGGGGGGGDAPQIDPAFKRVLMYLLVGSKGGPNRLQMISILKDEPMNANRMGERLGLDYKTVQHHLKILTENNVVVTNASGTYGAMYFLTPYLERHLPVVEEIRARFGRK
jgi:DNA-binding transcriptional ArsR family regulator